MNTLKFANKYLKTTEQHNLNTGIVYEDDLFGTKINMYHPINLNIFITNMCPYSCPFCINKDYSNKDISDELYYKCIRQTLTELKDKNVEITITGGEPTIKPERLVKTIRLCKELGFNCRTVSTTASNIFTLYEDKPLIQHLVENNFIHNINVSRMSINNNDIMLNKVIDEYNLQKLITFCNVNNAEMRISCNLINGLVDSMDKIFKYVDHFSNLGVNSILFRELVNYEGPILNNVVNFTDFTKIDEGHSIFYDVDIYEYKDFIVKYYTEKKPEYAGSMSLRNGILRLAFNGQIIKDFVND